jgi:hypothetical protein
MRVLGWGLAGSTFLFLFSLSSAAQEGTTPTPVEAPAPAAAKGLPADAEGWITTGEGTRYKKVAFIDVKVYAISHAMKQLPPKRSKQAVIDLDVDKKLTWKFLRDVPPEKIRDSLKDSFELNGYKDAEKTGRFTGAFTKEQKDGSPVVIVYDATKQATTITTAGGAATVEGVDFMKAVWSIWFAKINQPSLGDKLISRIP